MGLNVKGYTETIRAVRKTRQVSRSGIRMDESSVSRTKNKREGSQA